jgi:hypothetical protein
MIGLLVNGSMVNPKTFIRMDILPPSERMQNTGYRIHDGFEVSFSWIVNHAPAIVFLYQTSF